MTIIDASSQNWKLALRNRVAIPDPQLEIDVAEIISKVRYSGDKALLEFAHRYDSPELRNLEVTEEEFESATIPIEQLEALQTAYDRILAFHQAQVEAFTQGMTKNSVGWSWRLDAEEIGQRMRPLASAGLYVPGGRASYPSSVLMLSGPANAAGVDRLCVTTPSQADGTLPAAVLVALRIAGIKCAYKIGGASAIAALAFGTETVKRVDKIVGPGNKYVNEAKRQLWGSVGVDGNYGPSEVCVVVDERSNPAFAAADLLAQLEHAPDNLGFVVSLDAAVLEALQLEIQKQLESSPRAEILRACVQDVAVFSTQDRILAAEIINEIAPEHLTLSIKEPELLLDLIKNAGCILLGEWTPESAADYCLGPCHTLPTNAAARFANPVNALDFLKIQSVANLTRSQFSPLSQVVQSIATAEGFPAHGYAARVRDLHII